MVSSSAASDFSPSARLCKLLYDPPCSLETLSNKLQVSLIADSPRITRVALINRLLALDGSLSKGQAQSMADLFNAAAPAVLELTQLHNFFSNKLGKDKNSKGGTSVLERVLGRIRERAAGSGGIRSLGRYSRAFHIKFYTVLMMNLSTTFRVLTMMDTSGDKRLDKEELKYGLANYGIELNIRELDDIFNYFGKIFWDILRLL